MRNRMALVLCAALLCSACGYLLNPDETPKPWSPRSIPPDAERSTAGITALVYLGDGEVIELRQCGPESTGRLRLALEPERRAVGVETSPPTEPVPGLPTPKIGPPGGGP